MNKTNVKALALICMSLVLGSSSALGDQWDTLATKLGVEKKKSSSEKNVKEFFNKLGGDIAVEDNGFKIGKEFTIDGNKCNKDTEIQNFTTKELHFMYTNCGSDGDGFFNGFQGWRSIVVSCGLIGAGILGTFLVNKFVMQDKDSNQDNTN